MLYNFNADKIHLSTTFITDTIVSAVIFIGRWYCVRRKENFYLVNGVLIKKSTIGTDLYSIHVL